MNTYSSYKDSGIEWIGEIPSGWRIEKLKYIGNLYGGLTGKSGKDFNNEDNPYNKPFIPFTNIFNNVYISSNHFQYVNIKPDERQNRVIKNDLFFLMSSEGYEDLGKSSILISEIDELYLNSFCKGYRVNTDDVNPLFVNYQLLGNTHRKLISIEGKGFTRINLRQDKLKNTYMFIPPLQEQQQIVDYLDKKTSKIDKLIEKTEQKIELLKEQRTSLINTTVTKGLDPNVEMKDSGVEWIGKIPSEWNTISLRYYLIRVGSGSTPRGGGDVYSDNGIPFLRSQNVHFDGLHLEGVVFISEEIHQNMNNTIVKHGDVLLNITGGSIGRSCVVDTHEEMNVNQHVSILRTKESLINFYLNYCLVSSIGQEQVDYNQTGGNREGLSSDNIKNFKFVLPPLQEQQQIVDYINKKTSKIDKLVDIESKRIILLKEYRQSLISDVVTGKVDVRDEVLV